MAGQVHQRGSREQYVNKDLLQGSGPTHEEEIQEERYPSAVPFLPPLSASTVKYYYQFYAFAVGTIILFGGLLSPALEVNLGLGGMPNQTCKLSCSALLAQSYAVWILYLMLCLLGNDSQR